MSERNLARHFAAAVAAAGGAAQLRWAERVPVKDHLRRASLCDVALDTLHYNMGATGADTLYASVPVLHVPALAPVGRMMSAMLKALRMPELIFQNAEDVVDVAVALSDNRGAAKRARLRRKLVRRILWSPLYDVRAWVNDFDNALRLMWDQLVSMGDEQAPTWRQRTKHPHVVGTRPRAVF